VILLEIPQSLTLIYSVLLKMLPTSLVFHRRCLISFCLSAYLTETLFLSACQKNSCCFLCMRNGAVSWSRLL